MQSLNPILSALDEAAYPLFVSPETRWYRIEEKAENGVRQSLVTDPDGDLIRFQEALGGRAITDEGDTP